MRQQPAVALPRPAYLLRTLAPLRPVLLMLLVLRLILLQPQHSLASPIRPLSYSQGRLLRAYQAPASALLLGRSVRAFATIRQANSSMKTVTSRS